MRQLIYTMFVSNNHALFHLSWKENLAKHQKVSKYYENSCSFLHTAWNELYLPAAKAKFYLDSSHMQYYFSNHWSMQICSYFYDDKILTLKVLILKGSLGNTNTEIWSKEMSMGPYVAKMFFLQVDEGFWLYWCLM